MSRIKPAQRLVSGGVIPVLIVGLALFAAGTAASAEPAQQAAPTAAAPTAATTPAATAAGTAQPSCVSLPQGIQLMLANPQPGDTLLSGVPVNMSGIAYDTASDSGSGIASVTLYLGDRDAGGLSLGTALLGQPNPSASAGSQFATAGYTLRTPNLPSGSGSRSVFVYARSSITNVERVLEVPVFLNSAPTPVKGQVPTAVVAAPPACTPTPATTPTPTAAATSVPVAPVGVATLPSLPTLTPFPTLAIPAPAAVAPAPAVPAPPPAAAAAAPAAAAPAAVAPPAASASAQTTAPRGGGIPSELGLGLVTAGALILGGGVALRRRKRTAPSAEEEDSA